MEWTHGVEWFREWYFGVEFRSVFFWSEIWSVFLSYYNISNAFHYINLNVSGHFERFSCGTEFLD